MKKISYGNTDGKSPVRVECADGSVYTGDHVICTVSLGVLKYNHYFLFDPILPQKKIDTIDGLDFGTMNKIYLEWEEPFWSENEKHGIAFLWRPEEIKIIREEGNHWLESFFILSPVDYHPNLLCGWLTGPHARHTEQLSDEEIKSAVTSMLRMFLKHIHIPNPVRVKRYTFDTVTIYLHNMPSVSSFIFYLQVNMVYKSPFPWFILILFIEKRWIRS